MLSFIKRLVFSLLWTMRLRREGFPLYYHPNHHELETVQYFREPGRRLRDVKPVPLHTTSNVVMCFTNRCGSNWLAELLYSTGRLTCAEEMFNAEQIQEVCDSQNLKSLDEYIHFLPKIRDMQSGTFATKLSWNQLYFLTRIGVIPQILPNTKFIYMRRRDLAQQALSLLIAEQTGQWNRHWNSGINVEPNPSAITDEQIIEAIGTIERCHERFRHYFKAFGINPCIVYYRDVLDNPEGEVKRILEELGIEPPRIWSYKPEKITLKKQRNEQSKLRLEQFHESTGNRYAKDYFADDSRNAA